MKSIRNRKMDREPNKEFSMTMPNPRLLTEIRGLIETARQQVVRAVNSSMVQTYWHIGRLIIEDEQQGEARADRKSTRLNSSHVKISYAVFCLKKKIEFSNRYCVRLNGFKSVQACY